MSYRTKKILLISATAIAIIAITFNLIFEAKSEPTQRMKIISSQKIGGGTIVSVLQDNVTHETFYLVESKQFAQALFVPVTNNINPTKTTTQNEQKNSK